MQSYQIEIDFTFYHRLHYKGPAVVFKVVDGNFATIIDYIPFYRHELGKIIGIMFRVADEFGATLKKYEGKVDEIVISEDRLLEYIKKVRTEYNKAKEPGYSIAVIYRERSYWAEVVEVAEQHNRVTPAWDRIIVDKGFFEKVKSQGRPFRYSRKAEAYKLPRRFESYDEARQQLLSLVEEYNEQNNQPNN